MLKSLAEMIDRVGSAKLKVTDGLPLPGELLGEADEPFVKERFNVCDSRTNACPFEDEATRADVAGKARDTGLLPADPSLEALPCGKPEGEVDCLRVLFKRILLVGNGIAECRIFERCCSRLGLVASSGASAASSGKLSQLRALATLKRLSGTMRACEVRSCLKIAACVSLRGRADVGMLILRSRIKA